MRTEKLNKFVEKLINLTKQIWCRNVKRITECEESATTTGIGSGDEVENAGHATDCLDVDFVRRGFTA
jgi:hypothetical protein